MSPTTVAMAFAIGYLLGSVPASVIVTRRLRGIDIRDHGSGNAGAANVLRVVGVAAAVTVLLLDAAKGALAVVLVTALDASGGEAPRLLAGLAAVLGHLWPVYARFRGGKGVATAAGVMLLLHPAALAVSALVFVLTVVLSRRIAVGSVVSTLCLPLAMLALQAAGWVSVSGGTLGLAAFLALLIAWTHRSNLRNLAAGTEPKIGVKS